jgi:PGF-pre-PGF domain-containing protein
MTGQFDRRIIVITVFMFLSIVFSSFVFSATEVDVASGVYNLTVYVNDSTNNELLDNANVTLWNGATNSIIVPGYYLQTDSNGKVVFYNISSGNYSVLVNNRRGYYAYTPADTFMINASQGNYTFNVTLTRDFINPGITYSSPANNTKSFLLTRTFSFISSDDIDSLVNVSLYINDIYNQSLNGTGAGSFIATLPEGNHYWNLSVNDYWNNTNNTGAVNLTLDYTNPSYIDYNISTWSASGIGSQNASDYVYIWAYFNGTYTNITSVGLDVNTSGATYGTYTNTTRLQEGYYNFSFLMPNATVGEIYEFKLTATDEVTLTNTTTSFFVNLTDNLAPTITTISPQYLFIRPLQAYTINVTSADSIDSVLDVNISFRNTSSVLVKNITYSTRSGNEYRFSTTSNSVEGNYTLIINSTDDSGNMLENMTTWVYVDNSSPSVNVGLSSTSAKQNDVITVRANVTDVVDLDLDDYVVYVRSNQTGDFTDVQMVYLPSTTREFEANITITSSQSYDVAINVTAYDLAGNLGWDGTQVLSIDNSAPVVTINYPVDGITYEVSSILYNISYNYSIIGSSSSVYYFYANREYAYGWPSSASNIRNFTYKYPGKHSVTIYANDSVGNIGSDSVVFYTNASFNATEWAYEQNATSTQVQYVDLSSQAGPVLANYVDISSGSENNTVNFYVLFDDGKNITLQDVELNDSILNQNISVANNDTGFIDDYPNNYGAMIVDYIRPRYLDILDYQNMTLGFRYNSTEFDLIYMYRNNSGTETQTAISPCSGSLSSQTRCYRNEGGITKVYSMPFTTSTTNYYAFYLVNDTVAPTINITTTNNSIKNASTGHTLSALTNEQATCKLYFNDTSLANQSASGTSFSYTLPTLLNGDYEIYLECNDSYANSDTSWILMQIQDTLKPTISINSPSNGTTYTTTGSKTISITTSETANCEYNTTSLNFVYNSGGTDFTTTGSTTHSFSVTVVDNTTYNYYYKCQDLNGNQNTNGTFHRFSVSVPSSSGDDDDGDTGGDTGGTAPPTTSSTPDLYSATHFFSFINSQDGIDMTLNRNGVDLTKIVATLNNNVSSVTIKVDTFRTTSLESGETSIDEVSGQKDLYKYVRITPTSSLNDDDIDSASLTFRVEKSWFSGTTFTPQDIVFYKFLNNEWVKQISTYGSNDDSYHYYTVTSDGLSLYAIMAETNATTVELEPEQEVETVQSQPTESNPASSSSRSDDSGGLDTNTILIIVIVGGILGMVGYVGYKNKDQIMNSLQQQKKPMPASGDEVATDGETATVHNQKPAAPSATGTATASVTGKSAKVKPGTNMTVKQAVKAHDLHKPHEDMDMLVASLRELFKNVWKQGHSETAIKDSLYKHGWPSEKVEKAFDIIHKHLEDDFLRHKLGQPDPDVENLVKSIKSLLGKQDYGYTQDQIEKKLEQKGWPRYMIDEALMKLSKEMVLPFEVKINATQSQQGIAVAAKPGQASPKPSLAKTPSEELQELENYIQTVKKHGKKRDEVRSLLLSYGWQADIVDKLLDMYFKNK